MGFVFKASSAPHERPHIPNFAPFLVFSGSECNVLEQAAKQAPKSFWLRWAPPHHVDSQRCHLCHQAANTKLTVRVFHFTPLSFGQINFIHRSIVNMNQQGAILQATFKDDKHFAHHAAYQSVWITLVMKAAANHTRFLAKLWRIRQLNFLSMDGSPSTTAVLAQQKFPARHTLKHRKRCPSSWIISGPSGFYALPTETSCYWRRCIP